MAARLRTIFDRLSLAQRFMLASLGILTCGMLAIGWWVGEQIEGGVVHRTSATTALYVDSFVAPLVQELANGPELSAEHLAALDHLLHNTPLGRDIASFKMWDSSGRVVYATDPDTVGRTFPVQGGLAQAWEGAVAARLSDLDDEENAGERAVGTRLLEMYSPVRLRGSDQILAVAEFYQRVDDLEQEVAVARRGSWLVFGAGTLIMYALLSGFVRRASRTIQRQQVALSDQVTALTGLLAQNRALRDRVQRASGRAAALNERFLRRVGAELHDGPAQDISLALLRLDQAAATCVRCPVPGAPGAGDATAEQIVREALARAMNEVRAISRGLGLPELGRLTLAETLGRAVRAHAARTGAEVDQALGDLPAPAPLPVKIALYRVVQEALNNAQRHAAGADVRLRARASDGYVEVEIADSGPGLDAGRAMDGDDHLGLVGMRERVESLGGCFAVTSAPGHGTAVRARLPLEVSDDS